MFSRSWITLISFLFLKLEKLDFSAFLARVLCFRKCSMGLPCKIDVPCSKCRHEHPSRVKGWVLGSKGLGGLGSGAAQLLQVQVLHPGKG